MKLRPDQLKSFIDDLDVVTKAHREVIDQDPRISRPFHEAEAAARVKYENLTESRPTMNPL